MNNNKNTIERSSPDIGGVNTLQLNVASVVDVSKVFYTQTLNGNVYLSDNSPLSQNKGTQDLITVCTQGQVINWLVFYVNMNYGAPTVRINNIVFIHEDGTVFQRKVCEDLKIYGAFEKARNNLTPSYTYWAGTVSTDLPVGKYRYRLVMEIDTVHTDGQLKFMNLDSPSLEVHALKSNHS